MKKQLLMSMALVATGVALAGCGDTKSTDNGDAKTTQSLSANKNSKHSMLRHSKRNQQNLLETLAARPVTWAISEKKAVNTNVEANDGTYVYTNPKTGISVGAFADKYGLNGAQYSALSTMLSTEPIIEDSRSQMDEVISVKLANLKAIKPGEKTPDTESRGSTTSNRYGIFGYAVYRYREQVDAGTIHTVKAPFFVTLSGQTTALDKQTIRDATKGDFVNKKVNDVEISAPHD